MSSVEFYEKIRTDHQEALARQRLEYDDSFSSTETNRRFGYVLQIPMRDRLEGYQKFVGVFSSSEPNQNYYQNSDLHVTVFEFVSVRENVEAFEQNIPAFIEVCREALRSVSPFPIRFRGTIFTNTSGILAGYDKGQLVAIREQLRLLLQARGIVAIERYKSRSAHLSFMGYRQQMQDFQEFLRLTEQTKHKDFGDVMIDRFELVKHDWYNSEKTKRVIQEFPLRELF